MIQYYAMPGLKYRERLPARPDRVEGVINDIAEYFNVTAAAIAVRTRKRKIVDIRSIAIHFLRIKLHLTLREIGDRFSLDHTSVIWSLKRCKNLIDTDDLFARRVQDIYNIVY